MVRNAYQGIGTEYETLLRAFDKENEATQRCDLAMPKSWATFYNLEVVIALAFRLNTYEASRIREKVLESLTQWKGAGINLFFVLKDGGNDNYYHTGRNN